MTRARRRGEPVLALINVVFLLLVFFLLAGELARPRPADLHLSEIEAGTVPDLPDALAITRDGQLFWEGTQVSRPDLAAILAARPQVAVRLMPDRNLPAADLIALARELAAAGQTELRLVGERR